MVAAASTVAVVLCTPPLGLANASTRGPAELAAQRRVTAWSAGLGRRAPYATRSQRWARRGCGTATGGWIGGSPRVPRRRRPWPLTG